MKKLFPLYLVIFVGFLGYSLSIPLFPPLFLHSGSTFYLEHFSNEIRIIFLGSLLTIYPLGQFLGAPILGSLSDKFGRKKVLTVSLLIVGISYIFCSFSIQMGSLTFLFLTQFIAGLGEGNIVIAQSSIADVVGKKERMHKFGLIYLSASSAYIIGPLIGGKLADSKLVSWFNPALPFWLITALIFIMFFWILFTFEETHQKDLSVKINWFEVLTSFKKIFYDGRLRHLYFVNFLIYLAIFGYFRSYSIYLLKTFDMGVSRLSEFVAYVAVPIILTQLFIIKFLSKKFSSKELAIYSSFGLTLFLWTLLIPAPSWVLWITLVPVSFAIGICLPSCASLISHEAEESEQGTVLGNNQSIQVFAEAISGFWGAGLIALFIPLSLLTCSILSLLGALLLLFFRKSALLKS